MHFGLSFTRQSFVFLKTGILSLGKMHKCESVKMVTACFFTKWLLVLVILLREYSRVAIGKPLFPAWGRTTRTTRFPSAAARNATRWTVEPAGFFHCTQRRPEPFGGPKQNLIWGPLPRRGVTCVWRLLT